MTKGTSDLPLPLMLDNQLCFAVYSHGACLQPLLQAAAGAARPDLSAVSGDAGAVGADGIPVKDIGERLLLDSGTLTPLLKRMEAADSSNARARPQDERQVLIALTLRACAEGKGARPAAVDPRRVGVLDRRIIRDEREIIALRDRLNEVVRE